MPKDRGKDGEQGLPSGQFSNSKAGENCDHSAAKSQESHDSQTGPPEINWHGTTHDGSQAASSDVMPSGEHCQDSADSSEAGKASLSACEAVLGFGLKALDALGAKLTAVEALAVIDLVALVLQLAAEGEEAMPASIVGRMLQADNPILRLR